MDLIEAWRQTRKLRCPLCGSTYLLKKLDNGLWNTVEVPNKIWMPVVLQDGHGHNHKYGVCLACYYRYYEKHDIKEIIGTCSVMLRFNYQCYFKGSYFNYAVHGNIPNPQTGFITWSWDDKSKSVKKFINF